MRESRTFAERTKVLKSDEAKKRYFLVFEGASTEKIYFEALENARDDVEINPLIELVPIIRSYSEDGWSNPKKILDRIISNLKEEETGLFTYESLLNRIMDYLYDEKILTTSKVQAHVLWRILEEGCEKVLGKCQSDNVDNLVEDCNKLTEYLNQESDVVNILADISDIIRSSNITYDNRFDKICLIVDRDKESFLAIPENNQYDYVLRTCQGKGFGFYVSNPCFEFWLLLHFDEVFELDWDKLLENPQVTAKRKYTEHELRKLLPGYSKGKYHADILIKNLSRALYNAEKFCQNGELLVSEIGTNIGKLIKLLRGEKERERFK